MADAGYRHFPLSPPAADTRTLRMLTAEAATVCYCTVGAAVLSSGGVRFALVLLRSSAHSFCSRD
jgi:hypothetical protein